MAWNMFGFKLCCGETFQCLFPDGFPLSLGDGEGRQHCQQGKGGLLVILKNGEGHFFATHLTQKYSTRALFVRYFDISRSLTIRLDQRKARAKRRATEKLRMWKVRSKAKRSWTTVDTVDTLDTEDTVDTWNRKNLFCKMLVCLPRRRYSIAAGRRKIPGLWSI